jgi:hypothetical protein
VGTSSLAYIIGLNQCFCKGRAVLFYTFIIP